MAIVLANADGTVYHRYGGRSHLSPMNMDTLVEIMEKGLDTHQKYLLQPSPPIAKAPQTLSDLINNRLHSKIKPTYGCYHCHYAREARQYLAVEAGSWTPDQFWIWPLPKQIGLVMEQGQQYKVKKVIPGSAAALTNIKKGDQLQTLAGKKILTKYDIQWVLEQSTKEQTTLSYTLLRGANLLTGQLSLKKGWKIGNPQDYLWRVRNVFTDHMVKFLPTPGFIGSQLTQKELQALGLPQKRFALRITRLNYGTYLAGVRLGDIIISAGNKSDFKSPRDFYYWCELLRQSGRNIQIQLIRQNSLMKLMIGLNHLNYSVIEKAPQVMLGFIAQELVGNSGLRVGNVIEDSSAERAGLLVGDRIVSIEEHNIRTYDGLKSILNSKSPGDLFAIKVKRNGKLLSFAFILSEQEEQRSDLAKLSEEVKYRGQRIDCVVSIKLPKNKHIYSVHKKGFGLPTQLDFRGRGYKLVGPIKEPQAKKIEDGMEPMWILEGNVELVQTIEIIDVKKFHLLFSLYAQVCDDQSCYELRAIVANNGLQREFSKFRGYFDRQHLVSD